jgi:hypothetical protein
MQSRLIRVLTGLGLISLLGGAAWLALRPGVAGASRQANDPAGAIVAQADAPKVAADPVPPVTEGVRAPLVVSFGEAHTLPSGETELPVFIDVRDALSFPLSFRATLPRDATLVEGGLDAPVDGSKPGRQSRLFRFRTSAPLAADNPFRVVVQGEAADKSMGLRADRAYPAAAPVVRPPSAAPRAPNGRPPAAIAMPKAP